MDKYEEMAERFLLVVFNSNDPYFPVPIKFIADAFRWYEDNYLAEALTATTLMREKETCEWTRNKVGWYSRSCEKGQSFPKPDDGVCTSCNRRIVEVKK